MILECQNILDPKNHTKKNDKIHKNFELYQVFMHNFLYQNAWIFSLYIAHKKNQHSLIWRYRNILVRMYRSILGQKNHTRKIDKIHKSL